MIDLAISGDSLTLLLHLRQLPLQLVPVVLLDHVVELPRLEQLEDLLQAEQLQQVKQLQVLVLLIILNQARVDEEPEGDDREKVEEE